MNSESGSLTCMVFSYVIGGAIGALGAAMLIILGDWTGGQALFAAVVLAGVLGTFFAVFLCGKSSGPVRVGTAGSTAQPAAPARPASASSPAAAAPQAEAPAPAPAAEPAPAAPVSDPVVPAPLSAGEGTRPAGLDGPREGGADDLKRIKGVGPKLERLLYSMGYYHFDQIAGWSAHEIAWVDENLQGFKGRVSRDNWVDQARLLAAGGDTDFSRRVDGGDVY